MISRWKWMLKQTFKKLWFRATLFAIVAIITALLSILFKSMIPESVSVKVGAEAVDKHSEHTGIEYAGSDHIFAEHHGHSLRFSHY